MDTFRVNLLDSAAFDNIKKKHKTPADHEDRFKRCHITAE